MNQINEIGINPTNHSISQLFPNRPTQKQLIFTENKNICAQCCFYRSYLSRSQTMQDQNMIEDITLRIIDDYVLQLAPTSKSVVSYFKCDYEIQFQILRKSSSVANRLGEAEGISFLFKTNQNNVIELKVKNEFRQNLQKFGKVLGRKFIVQLGFHTSFKAIKKIGKGMTACVYDAINFANGRQVAIKSFKRSVYFQQDNGNGKISFMNEFKILTEVSHKNLCQLLSVYQTDNSTYVILELYPLSLYGYIQKCGFPNLEQAKIMIINLLEGLAYLHEKGIMHRDLKLENIMVKKQPSGKVIPVIVDFGLAEYTSNTKYMYTRCGTPGYVAPQVLKLKSTDPNQTYTSACDLFSIGVIFHILLFKKPLFQGKDIKQVIKKNGDCQINFQEDLFKNLPPNGKDLLQQLLCKDPRKRITAINALNHPFLADQRKKQELQSQNIYNTQYSIYS